MRFPVWVKRNMVLNSLVVVTVCYLLANGGVGCARAATGPAEVPRGYPRIGAYVGVRSGGSPLVSVDGNIDSAMCRKLARYPQVVIDLNALLISPNIVPTLVNYRSDIEVVGYHLTAHWYLLESFVPQASDKSFDAYWHLAIKSTNGFLASVPEGYEVNLGQKSTADSLAALSLWGVQRLRVRGWFGDYFSPEVSWTKVGNEFTDKSRVSNLTRWVSRLRAGMPSGFRTYGNGTGADKVGLDGTMREGFPSSLPTGTFTLAMTQHEGDWLKAEHAPGTWGDPKAVRFLLATACMTGATATYGKQVVSTPWQGELWFPEYAVDPQGRPDATGRYIGWLGQPLGAWTKLASGLYVRFFEHGVVLLNPTGSIITQDMLFVRWSSIGSNVPQRVVTVGAMDALFLWGE